MEDMVDEVNIRIEIPNDEFLNRKDGNQDEDDAMEWDNNEDEQAKVKGVQPENESNLEDGEISEADGSESGRTTSSK